MHPAVRNALLDALAVILPVDCAGCGAHDRSICDACAVQLEPNVVERSIDGLAVFTALLYAGPVRELILAMKEANRTDVVRALARPLSAAIDSASPAQLELVQVPTSTAAFRRRGYDPVRLLLRRGGYRPARVLRTVRATRRQKSLDVDQRWANQAGAMRATVPLNNRQILLVDDVVTTGSTICEAARAVTAAGGHVVGAAALAFTVKLHEFS